MAPTWQLPKLLRISKRYSSNVLPKVVPQNIRNIGIIAHIDAGKTTTTERMIFNAGMINRAGNVDDGDTVTDYLPSERDRGITIQLAAITLPWWKHRINLLDTPGHADFTFEVIRSLRVLDGAVTILDAVAGVEAQTEKVWKQAANLNIPSIIYVNKMDRPGAGFSRAVKEVVSKIRNSCVFRGVIDVLEKSLLTWKEGDDTGKAVTATKIDESNPDLFEMLKSARESMIETLGEYDERVIEALIEHDEDYMAVPSSVLDEVIRKATIERYLAPVFCGSSFRNYGVHPLMDGIVKYLPSPLETDPPVVASKGKPVPVALDKTNGLIVNGLKKTTLALVFKVMTLNNRPMTFVRVYCGKLTKTSHLFNTRTGKRLNLKGLQIMNGDIPQDVKDVGFGNICVIPGFETELQTGDTLSSSEGAAYTLLPIDIPPPLFNSAIEPRTAGDEKHMLQCVDKLIREDPSLTVHYDEEMGQIILGGMGELHLEIARDRMINDMKARVNFKDVVVSYKECFGGKRERKEETVKEEQRISLTMSYLENAKDFIDHDGARVLEEDNNVVLLPRTAASDEVREALDEGRWKCENTIEELEQSIINGIRTCLLMGGPLFSFPIHSTLITVNEWSAAVTQSAKQDTKLMYATIETMRTLKENPQEFAVVEPIMMTKVYVSSNDLGEVSHDLANRCSAVILEVQDQSIENLETAAWAKSEAERIYLPPDYTNTKTTSGMEDIANKKLIVAETPLREMIGYLSKLRSITQGRATFDMSFQEMRRAPASRNEIIGSEFRF
ncbi:Ribosome-releasing factor 2, mitochondrial [Candida viswanathii]|uniref:Ribosome-releasing factor 2, mitochondrial n=1 Tax=Candida viswanathii TaxID=5486 RepID=A0A367Y618_9ASCO|nr:Ribosome-releasing factor 2, mitochondrial [Candida viswanathii]